MVAIIFIVYLICLGLIFFCRPRATFTILAVSLISFLAVVIRYIPGVF